MPYGHDLTEEGLSSLARQRIAHGELPQIISLTVFAGDGSGEFCSLCGVPIVPHEVIYEVVRPSTAPLQFHRARHDIWQLECRKG